MKKLLFIAVSAIIATTVAVFNVTPIKDTQIAEVKTVEIVTQVNPITEIEEVSIIEQPVEQITIEEPVILSEVEKQSYIQNTFLATSSYFASRYTTVQLQFKDYFLNHPEYFNYDNIDTNIAKLKDHLSDVTRQTTYLEVKSLFQSLVL